jgi:N-methylhydantoinase B
MEATAPVEILRDNLDPVTFEVLKNGFVNIVDQMGEVVVKTCYSFVIYARDFSSSITDFNGDTVAQGTQDIAAHVGTLHFTVKACIEDIGRANIHPGDVMLFNDPYRGGTHFPDVRVVRPVFYRDELIAFTVVAGHWSDVGGSVPGSFDIEADEFYSEGVRIPATKIVERGVMKEDLVREITSNMRVSFERMGDLRSQLEASKVGAEQIVGLCEKYGKETVLAAFARSQDYAERMMREEMTRLPRGTFEADDFIDQDMGLGVEGLVRIHVALTITDDSLIYDLTGTDPEVGWYLNGTYSSTYSAILTATKIVFPQVPLNSGIFRIIRLIAPEGSVVNAREPAPVAGFAAGSFEKVANASLACWSQVRPEQGMGSSFNIEYVMLGGIDRRPGLGNRPFIYYDWLSGGWGGRFGKDGPSPLMPIFGVGLINLPAEGNERTKPVLIRRTEIVTDSAGPGRWRGGVGIATETELGPATKTNLAYTCDRERSIVRGIFGGLPGFPHGVYLNPLKENRYLGASFNYKIKSGQSFWRCSSGGGGYGDPLERDPKLVIEDLADGYVSVERAEKDYGIVVRVVDEDMGEYEIDADATRQERDFIRTNRKQWLQEDPEKIRAMVAEGAITLLDAIRRYGVILDRKTMELLPRTTSEFRKAYWAGVARYW